LNISDVGVRVGPISFALGQAAARRQKIYEILIISNN